MDNFTSREFRDALGKYATGVTVVTAIQGEKEKIGITINSFSSVSLEPPLILYSLAKTYHHFEALSSVKNFAVNVLDANQRQISQTFAHAEENQWNNVGFEISSRKNLILKPNLAVFECVPFSQTDGGDHLVILGRVVGIFSEEGDNPLLYFGGKYRSISPIDAQ
ncbi:MAG: nitrilotriacetate monooxygenase [Rhodospirillaceae bacterium]|uniref:p-hydroxyphenylacetate 3-hydroxylase, reductase component n=1 Tax=Candidatus Moanibacter tarae TaxID=2200854 RepID=A0A2Z4API5_9BACT|nr:MAG: p-hydroxyphenylacetate 3-hydroxylase, reductase component [Candidatus Moanabacter tarae]MBH66969.1 nitrilotriacetate monooxygenase [Rhodospirillaceae bacterium]|tara:strand:+ start:2040 stop:2534 length:495 start_codon:yes stop_codon:yes gene_type:complete